MAKFIGGPWGDIIGKLGNVVGQKWKGFNVGRKWTKPANPRTPKQVFQRDRLSYIGQFCGLIKEMAVLKFWKQYENNTTALSECSRTNINLQPPFVDEGTPFVPAPLNRLTSRGNLEAIPSIIGAEYAPATGALDIGWGPEIVGNGADTDKAYVQIVDQLNLVSLANDTVTRVDEGLSINIGAGRTAANIYIFVTMYRDLPTGIFNSVSLTAQTTSV